MILMMMVFVTLMKVYGCQDSNACNYNANATEAGECIYLDGICETCENGVIVDNDSDDDFM